MKRFFCAQSTLEFMMITLLVLAGIMVMGPYVLRGVNAYMRSWELSADQARNNPTVIIQPWEVPGGGTPPATCETDCSICQGPNECSTNNSCTFVTRHMNLDPPEPCAIATYCVKTTVLSDDDCEGNWTPGEDCCQTDPGCPECPH